jgi:hypothetical protein
MAPFQTLGWRHAGAGGVALDANGKIEIVVTPLADNKDNSSIQVGKLEISDSGEVSGKLKVGFGGQQALDLRQLGVRSGAEAVLAALNSYLAAKAPQGTTVEVDHIAGLDDPSRQLVAVVNVSGTLGTKTGDKLTLPRLFFDTKEANPFPASTTRTLPVDMHYAAQEQEQITYGFPEGYVLEAAPEDAKLAWENNAVYQLRSKVEPTQITSARILARGFTLLDAKDYTALHDFYQKVVAADQMHIVLKPAAK